MSTRFRRRNHNHIRIHSADQVTSASPLGTRSTPPAPHQAAKPIRHPGQVSGQCCSADITVSCTYVGYNQHQGDSVIQGDALSSESLATSNIRQARNRSLSSSATHTNPNHQTTNPPRTFMLSTHHASCIRSQIHRRHLPVEATEGTYPYPQY